MAYWNVDGEFSLPDWDSQPIRDRKYSQRPWNPGSWGVQGETFLGEWGFLWGQSGFHEPIAWQRYYVRNGLAYLYGKEAAGRFGFVRYVQGSVWRQPHHGPAPLPLHTEPSASFERYRIARPYSAIRNLRIHLDLHRGDSNLYVGRHRRQTGPTRVMYAINLWITGPYFPGGTDAVRRKPLVFDLAFHTEGSVFHGSVRSFESAGCFHYQESLEAAPLGRWKSYDIDLRPIVARALQMFGLQAEGAAIYQLEFLLELVNAEAFAMIDNFHLAY